MHHNTRIILSLSAIMFVVGCKQSERLTINTQPLMSVVTVRDPQGTVVCSQPAPVDIRIPFKDLEPSAFYDIKITPPAESAQSFLPYAGTIKSSDYAQFPGESPVKKSMYVTLETKKFVTLETAELFVSNGVWKGWLTTSRAWQDIAEAGGQVPTLLMNFRDFAVQGISISPGGDRLVFSSVAFNKNNNEQPALGNANPVEVNQKNNEFGNLGARDVKIVGCNLQAISVNGGGIQQITQENFRDLYPRFSPDGQRILFSSNRRDPQGASLLSMSAAGKSGIANNYIDPRDGLALFPSMSIDGTIAFSLLPKGTSESYIWSLGGTNQFPTQITVGDQPNISPDGKRIAYIGKDGNLWTVDLGGTNQIQITFGAADILERYKKSLDDVEKVRFDNARQNGVRVIYPYASPSWSLDGRFIVFSGMDGNDPNGRPNADVWLMNADGSDRQQLTTNGSQDNYPLMSPDGKFIYFVSNRGGQWGIWKIATPENSKQSK